MRSEVGHAPIVKNLRWSDEAATQLFASRLAAQPGLRHAFIELRGELGAGKTTFVRYLLRALGVTGRVKSPTYAVVEPYELVDMTIWHFDFYRFNDPQEWEDAGFKDIFLTQGLKISEWSEKAIGYIPQADLHLDIQILDNETRQVRINTFTEKGRLLLV